MNSSQLLSPGPASRLAPTAMVAPWQPATWRNCSVRSALNAARLSQMRDLCTDSSGSLLSPEARHTGLAGLRSTSRGGHDLGERRSDLGILAFRETVPNTWIKPVAYR